MREIREKIQELTERYCKQLNYYRQILSSGANEVDWIRHGEFDRLVEILHQKQDFLNLAGQEETGIQGLQKQLERHFGLAEFSIPRLREIAPKYYQKDLELLEEQVAQIVPVLEVLEEQERQNEAALTAHLENQKPQTKAVEIRRAGRAYGKDRT